MNKVLLIIFFSLLTSCATTLKQEHIKTAIEKISPSLESCVQYHTRLKPDEQFRTSLKMNISKSGKPENITMSGIGNIGLRQCLNSEVQKLKFNIPSSKKRAFTQNLVFRVRP